MRIAYIWIWIGVLGGCSATSISFRIDFAEIDTTVASGCIGPSAVVRELRNAESRGMRTGTTPVRVPAGVYSIGVSCGSIFDSAAGACIDTSKTASQAVIPPYELLLQSGKRYVFSCSLVKDQYVVRLSEGAL
jgi:hypothetical protein